jgi:hypothetical protein
MSVRAYRVIKQKIARNESFNVWHDEEFMNWLETQDDVSIRQTEGGSGEGTIEVSVEILEKSILPKNVLKLKLIDDTVEAIKADIAFAKKHKDEYVLYECY